MTEAAEGEIQLQATSSPSKASVWAQESNVTSNLQAKIPVLCLRSVFAPLAGYLCDLCSQTFSDASDLVKHKQLHENPASCDVRGNVVTQQEEFPKHVPEPSFPCNICDRSFPTNPSLKRHKLLHVRDGRRCPKCGQIFCQLHNHVLFMPLPQNEQNSTTDECLSLDTDLNDESSSDNSVLEQSESSTDESDSRENSLEDACPLEEPERESESSAAESGAVKEPGLFRETQNPLPPASFLNIPKEIPLPKLKRVLNPHVCRYFRGDYPTDYVQLHLPQQPRLRPPLKVFSPQCLTSTLLEVRRNYEYILSKPVKAEESKSQYTAYDLEFVIQNTRE